ncbi:MAG: dihydrofolate reductase family protein, partial [Cyclobacteriaceae bacterium]
VLVGSGTAWHDNPMLNVRDWSGRDPARIVIDRYLKLGPNQSLFNRKQKTICYNLMKDEGHENLSYVRLKKENFLPSMVQHLYNQGIQSLMVEGGGKILNSFIESNLWDEARVFISPQQFRDGVAAPRIRGVLQEIYKLDNDWLRILAPLSMSIESKAS